MLFAKILRLISELRPRAKSCAGMRRPVVMRIAKTKGEVRFDHDQIDGFQRAAEHFGSRIATCARRRSAGFALAEKAETVQADD
jgi:histone H3/H4